MSTAAGLQVGTVASTDAGVARGNSAVHAARGCRGLGDRAPLPHAPLRRAARARSLQTAVLRANRPAWVVGACSRSSRWCAGSALTLAAWSASTRATTRTARRHPAPRTGANRRGARQIGSGVIVGAMKDRALLASPWGAVAPLQLDFAPPAGVNPPSTPGCPQPRYNTLAQLANHGKSRPSGVSDRPRILGPGASCMALLASNRAESPPSDTNMQTLRSLTRTAGAPTVARH